MQKEKGLMRKPERLMRISLNPKQRSQKAKLRRSKRPPKVRLRLRLQKTLLRPRLKQQRLLKFQILTSLRELTRPKRQKPKKYPKPTKMKR